MSLSLEAGKSMLSKSDAVVFKSRTAEKNASGLLIYIVQQRDGMTSTRFG